MKLIHHNEKLFLIGDDTVITEENTFELCDGLYYAGSGINLVRSIITDLIDTLPSDDTGGTKRKIIAFWRELCFCWPYESEPTWQEVTLMFNRYGMRTARGSEWTFQRLQQMFAAANLRKSDCKREAGLMRGIPMAVKALDRDGETITLWEEAIEENRSVPNTIRANRDTEQLQRFVNKETATILRREPFK